MKKLGFAIKVASQGAANVIECNSGQWTKQVIDIRDYMKLFTGLSGTDNIVTFISFDASGCFLTLLRSISGRAGDFLSGWIYIPNTIEIDGNSVVNAYNFVKRVLGESNVKSISGQIDSFFATEYPQKEFPISYTPSSGNKYGLRYLTLYSLKELLDKDRYQSYYSHYKAVFLMEKEGEVKISKEAVALFDDLTKNDLVSYCVLKAPTKDGLSLMGNGMKVCRENGKEVTSNITCKLGDIINLIFERNGFEPIPKQIDIVKEVSDFPIFKDIIWKKRISRSMFQAIDENSGKSLTLNKITINNIDIPITDYPLDEKDCKNASVTVNVNGYEEQSKKVNLLNVDKIQFVLKRKTQSYNYMIEMANGHSAEMTLETKHFPSLDTYISPLYGYKFDKHDNHKLLPNSLYKWKQRMLGFVSCLTAVALLIIGVHIFSSLEDSNDSNNSTVQTGNTSSKDNLNAEKLKKEKEQKEKEAAINYLNSNEKWAKDSLEKFALTQGLFHLLNNYEFDSLSKINIDGVKSLEGIVSLSKDYAGKNFKLTSNYSSDGTISPNMWIETLKKKYIEVKTKEDEKTSGPVGSFLKSTDKENRDKEKKEVKQNKDKKDSKENHENKNKRGGGGI